MPFTLRNLREDLEDFGSRFDGASDLEFRLATDALELEQSGLSWSTSLSAAPCRSCPLGKVSCFSRSAWTSCTSWPATASHS